MDVTKTQLTHTCHELRNAINTAKQQWLSKLTVSFQPESFSQNPRESWKALRHLQNGRSAHHKLAASAMHMRIADGTRAMSDDENADVFAPHFSKVFNRDDAPVDWSVLDEISQ